MLDYNRLLYLDGVLLDGILGPFPGAGTGTDNALVRWDGVNFDHIQACPGITCDDSGDITSAGTINAVVFDTNVAAAALTLSGTALAADGTDIDINIAITPKGAGEVDITRIDIDAGAIDGCEIATSNITVGIGYTLDVSLGTLTLADDQISGDKVEGGTIAAITIADLYVSSSLGIGTNTPCSLLEIWDDDAHPILSITAAHNTDYDPQIQLRTDATDTVKFSMGVDGADDKFKIYSGSGIGGTSEFVIDLSGNVGIGIDSPTAKFHMVDGALLFTGTGGSFTPPASVAGTRMFWYPAKSALRAGKLTESYKSLWDDANIGTGSIALGVENRASGTNSVALGEYAQATGVGAIATSQGVASGIDSVAISRGAAADADYGIAIGRSANAKGQYGIAIGQNSVSAGNGVSVGITAVSSVYANLCLGISVTGSNYLSDVIGRGITNSTVSSVLFGYNANAIRLDATDIYNYLPITLESTAPVYTFHNTTESDAADSGMSILWFSREQSGGEETHGAAIKAAHDGSSDDQKGYLAFFTNDGSDDDAPTERMRIDSVGHIGIGTTAPDKMLEINKSTGGEIRLTYNDANGSATDYADMVTDSNGGFTLTTVDSDGAAGHINLNPDGNVGINEATPGASLQITNAAAADIGQIIELAASPIGNAFEVNTNGASGGDLIKFTSGGKIQTTAGFRAVAKEFSDAFVSWKYGGDTAEHSGQTGSYDHTGGTYERLFTATVAVFSQDDEDNHTWIVINSGAYKGAKAEIETYVDTTHVVVRGMGWDGDISSSTFSIVPHPLFIAGDGCNIAFCVGDEGSFHIFSKGFTGLAEEESIIEFKGDFGADDKECFYLEINANGYNHIDGVHMDYITGDLQPGDYTHGIHISINDSGATSADSTTEIDCLAFETADISSISQHAIHVGVGFDSALLVSGAAAEDPDYGYEVASGAVVDRVNSGGAGDDAFINAAVDQQIFDADNDYILIGNDDTFEVINCVLATPGNQDAELEFYYSKAGGNWTQFFPSDNTAGFTKSGNISFSAPGDWTKDDEAEANGDITEAYYIKIMRTRNNLVTPPTEDYFKIYSSLEAGMSIRGDGTIKPASLADAGAPNESIYYSTTQSKLVYKDSGGGINDLY